MTSLRFIVSWVRAHINIDASVFTFVYRDFHWWRWSVLAQAGNDFDDRRFGVLVNCVDFLEGQQSCNQLIGFTNLPKQWALDEEIDELNTRLQYICVKLSSLVQPILEKHESQISQILRFISFKQVKRVKPNHFCENHGQIVSQFWVC